VARIRKYQEIFFNQFTSILADNQKGDTIGILEAGAFSVLFKTTGVAGEMRFIRTQLLDSNHPVLDPSEKGFYLPTVKEIEYTGNGSKEVR
jgi:hypothetical protein